MSTLFLSNVLFGFSCVFALVPVTTLSLGTLMKKDIPNAAGIHSLVKCVGGSIFTSLSASFAIRYGQVHQNYLVKNMTVYNPNFVRKYSALTKAFTHYGSSYIATHKANAVLFKQMLAQSTLCAIVDLFQVFALITFIAIPFVFLLKDDRSVKN